LLGAPGVVSRHCVHRQPATTPSFVCGGGNGGGGCKQAGAASMIRSLLWVWGSTVHASSMAEYTDVVCHSYNFSFPGQGQRARLCRCTGQQAAVAAMLTHQLCGVCCSVGGRGPLVAGEGARPDPGLYYTPSLKPRDLVTANANSHTTAPGLFVGVGGCRQPSRSSYCQHTVVTALGVMNWRFGTCRPCDKATGF
jgi:hypothetical protein